MGGLLLRNQTFDFSSTDSTHKAYYPSYDLDGNATSYPVPANPGANATLVWDAENRLTSATIAGVTTTYRYDYLSRRIAKITNNPITNNPVTVSFLYDGWNLIAEYTGTVLEKTYTWGMDVSGSMQGAGGVGGLLSVHDQVDTYYPTYDGNGNVSEYLNATGAVQAHYEYDPFGNTTVSTGAKKADFFHRFSTKPQDAETGLYYYGYRYYDPVTGRWPSRDPLGDKSFLESYSEGRSMEQKVQLEEEALKNLYGFVDNSPTNRFDNLGLLFPTFNFRKALRCCSKTECKLHCAVDLAACDVACMGRDVLFGPEGDEKVKLCWAACDVKHRRCVKSCEKCFLP